ncbi:MAG: sodium:calcium exchanger, partial [Okeania sp. SIO3C4]|nr:sodium:calcium exchanger [Okeania sp. SIO3C4]
NNEKFEVNLSRARNARLSDRKAVGTIRDNDEKVIIPEISISDARVTEGNRGEKKMKFEVELSAASQKTVQVNYATKDGSAKSGEDYEKVSGVVKFQPGQKKKVVSVPVLGDNRNENNEEFEVNLSRAKNAKLSDRKGVGTIQDNDTEPVKPKEPVEPIFPDAINLGLLSQKQISRVDNIGLIEGVNNRDTEDFYRFKVRKEGTVSIFVDNFVQDLGVKLYDEDETLINQSNVDGIRAEVIQTTLEPGVYYVEVFPVGSGATGYRLIANIV